MTEPAPTVALSLPELLARDKGGGVTPISPAKERPTESERFKEWLRALASTLSDDQHRMLVWILSDFDLRMAEAWAAVEEARKGTRAGLEAQGFTVLEPSTREVLVPEREEVASCLDVIWFRTSPAQRECLTSQGYVRYLRAPEPRRSMAGVFHFGSSDPSDLRADGWQVAVHNDYRQDGVQKTFWLLTHPSGRYLKGEAPSDAEALDVIRNKLTDEAAAALVTESGDPGPQKGA